MFLYSKHLPIEMHATRKTDDRNYWLMIKTKSLDNKNYLPVNIYFNFKTDIIFKNYTINFMLPNKFIDIYEYIIVLNNFKFDRFHCPRPRTFHVLRKEHIL